jgi:hypothetical protein
VEHTVTAIQVLTGILAVISSAFGIAASWFAIKSHRTKAKLEPPEDASG